MEKNKLQGLDWFGLDDYPVRYILDSETSS